MRDLSGRRFGRLTVICRNTVDQYSNVKYLCVCDCGVEKSVFVASLTSGRTKSCGCLQRELLTKHGKHGSPEYRSWASMLHRCENPSDNYYDKYGGRGITVCNRWKVLDNFLVDMGPRPPGHSLDRIDNNGNYEPGNCRWATPEVQANNTSRNVFIEYQDQRLTLSQWSRRTGIAVTVIRDRYLKGWPLTKVFGGCNA